MKEESRRNILNYWENYMNDSVTDISRPSRIFAAGLCLDVMLFEKTITQIEWDKINQMFLSEDPEMRDLGMQTFNAIYKRMRYGESI